MEGSPLGLKRASMRAPPPSSSSVTVTGGLGMEGSPEWRARPQGLLPPRPALLEGSVWRAHPNGGLALRA
jgi:hypothetical protein